MTIQDILEEEMAQQPTADGQEGGGSPSCRKEGQEERRGRCVHQRGPGRGRKRLAGRERSHAQPQKGEAEQRTVLSGAGIHANQSKPKKQ